METAGLGSFRCNDSIKPQQDRVFENLEYTTFIDLLQRYQGTELMVSSPVPLPRFPKPDLYLSEPSVVHRCSVSLSDWRTDYVE